jgi:hypothetical protein
MSDERQWRLERPGAGAEEMFKDDPFMLASVRSLRAESDPVEKPGWWIALLFLTGVLLACAGIAIIVALGWPAHPLVALSGFFGGCTFFAGLVGHRPGNFRVRKTNERLTLWKPTRGWMRVAFLAGGLAFAAAGPVLVMLDASQHPAPVQHRGARPRR